MVIGTLLCVFLKVYAPTGPVNRDYDDVRRYGDAAMKGIKRHVFSFFLLFFSLFFLLSFIFSLARLQITWPIHLHILNNNSLHWIIPRSSKASDNYVYDGARY